MEDSKDLLIEPKRYSAVWEHFTRKPNFIASCNICKKDYSYKSSLSNLTKHRKRKHIQKGDDDTTDCSDDDTSNNSNDFTKSFSKNIKKMESVSKSTWQHFEVLDSDQFVAKCKTCEKDISFDTVAQLTEHVKEHNIPVSDDEEWLLKENRSTKKQGKRANASAVWRFMEVLDEEAKNAMCLICRRQLSYMTGTSNLWKHIHRIHPHISIDEDSIESSDKKVILGTDGQFYEIASSDEEKDPIQTDEVYLEETIDDDVTEHIQNGTPPKKIKIIDKKPLKRKLVSKELLRNYTNIDTVTNTCDDTSKKHTSKEDSLEIFGQYVISLLKQLPVDVSDQLQSDFIKQIFTAKIALKTPYSVSLNEKPITVTINNGTSDSIPEITVHNTSNVIVTDNNEKSLDNKIGNEK